MTQISPRRAYLPALLGVLALILLVQIGSPPDDNKPGAAPAEKTAPHAKRSGGHALTPLNSFESWLRHYDSASEDRRQALLEEGQSLAQARREAFLALMKNSPEAALERALSLSEFTGLPPELAPFFERPISGIGSIDLRWRTNIKADDSLDCRHEHVLHLEGKSWMAYGKHLRSAIPPQKDVPVRGIALDGIAVLAPAAVQPLAPRDLAAARELFPTGNPDLVDPVTGGPAFRETAALVGGRIYHFQSDSIIDHVAETLVRAGKEAHEADRFQIEHDLHWLAASGGSGGDEEDPVDATPFMEDNIDVLFIRLDFSDFPGAPVSQVDLETTLASVNSNVVDYSYAAATINYTVTPTVYRMPNTGASYAVAGNNSGIQTDARALASADFTIANYDVIAVFFPNLGGVPNSLITYGGLGSIGGSNHWINGFNNTNTILHEFGHNYGIYHANYWDDTQTLSGRYDVPFSREYGDIFDRMGSGSAPEGHFSHFAKNRLQWMPDSKVAEANADGLFRIYRFDHANALANPTLALKVPMGGDIYYWVGYRQLYTSSTYNLSTGAYIVAEGLSQNAETNLIDATPGSASPESEDRKDCGLEVGTPFIDSGVTFEATARGGSAPNEWIDVQVTFAARVGLVSTSVEVDEQAGLVYLELQRQFSSTGIASVDYATSNGTATAGSDYNSSTGTVTWANGDSNNKIIEIPITPDTFAEGTETLTVTLSNPAGTNLDGAATTATVTILDPGARCTTFSPSFFNNSVYAIATLADGKILIGGNINHTSGEFATVNDLARLNPDGSVDSSFVTGTGFNNTVRAIAVQPDGKILVGGDFTTYNGTSCDHLIRLNPNGSIDTNIGNVDNGTVYAIAVEDTEKILVGGSFNSFDSTAVEGMIRLNTDGTRDTATPLVLPFTVSWNTAIRAILVQTDGKIMAAGSFIIGGSGNRQSGIVRLNASGSHDTSFSPGNGAHIAGSPNTLSTVYAVAALSDGTYVVGGGFTAFNLVNVPYIAHLNAAGSLDLTYTPPAFSSTVRALKAHPFGDVFVGGSFTAGAPRLARLNPDGTAESTFNAGTGPSGTVHSLGLAETGQLYVGGNFFQYNGSSSRPIVKIAGGTPPYGAWIAANFTPAQIAGGLSHPDSDPDGDGYRNAVERVLGTSPATANYDPVFGPGGAGTVTLVPDSGSDYIEVTVTRSGESTGASFHAIFSSDLDVWLPSPAFPGPNAVYDIIEDSPSKFVIRDKTPFSGHRYVKIGITTPN